MMARLKDICTINPKSPEFQDELAVSFVPMPKVGENGEFDPSEVRTYQDVKKGFTYFQNGDVLFAKITPCMENGKGAIAQSLQNGIGFGSTEFYVLRPLSEYVTSKWLFYLLNWQVFRKEAEKNMTGSAGQKRVPKSFLEEYVVNIPDLSTQEEMTNTLDKISDLISLRKQQLSKLDELVKARFVEMFGDPVGNPYGLPCKQLGQLLTVEPQNGLYKPQSDYVQDRTGVPILRIDAFYNGKVTDFTNLKRLICSDIEVNRYLLHEDDIVINRVNSIEYLGKCAHITGTLEKTVFESNMMRFHLNENLIDAVYATHLLCSQYIYNQILQRAKKAVNQASINQGDVQSLVLLVPPLYLQKQFAAFATQTGKSRLTIQQSLDKLEMLKKALMQEYFG